MSHQVLFAVVFVSQILVIQFYFPRKLARVGLSESFAQWCAEVAEVKGNPRRSFGIYRILNAVVATVGVFLLGAVLFYDLFDQMTQILLLIGAFLLLQVLPLALPNMRRLGHFMRETRLQLGTDEEISYDSVRLFDFVSPLTVVLAIVLYASYVVFGAVQWTGELNSQIAKTAILTGTNLLLLVLAGRALSQVKQSKTENRDQLYKSLFMMMPLFVNTSIMLSIYYFAKEVLFGNDLHLLRPAMMSAFLQILAILLFNALFLVRRRDQ